ncbi:beta-ketoacyl-ACP synthase 3 [Saccharothrix australiensis]|uniref:3-oxoacyl-[acyl-carrier-protein] synthase-3 n=1 Tax=Saccharothrix australiensis TaxID=2072 RepID=A0A495W2G6_9PSEU|nr:beta-ketoacyl-ACP synthase 3 [Saccharothrix australiensis]RKT55659.1 3-oxoacyl-[acyl-carrier-protein] synthase-3 [Saccharothrix australiensis]
MIEQLAVPRPEHARILGVGAYRPRRVVTNEEVCARMDSTPEWVETRSGIRTRRFAGDDETLCAMAVAAGRAALDDAGVAPGQLDCVVVASMSVLVQTPPRAVLVAAGLGASAAAGFDLSAACAGFCHALAVAGDMVRAGSARHVLVVGAERMTDIIDPADRSVAFMFADGAGAVVVGPSPVPAIGPVVRWADGGERDALRMNTTWDEFRADPSREPPAMRMDGRRVFRWVVENVAPAALKAVEAAGLSVGDLAAFIPHQANTRMIDVLADRLGLPGHVVVARDVVSAGNTSAASIPLAMERLVRSGAAVDGPALLFGFGAGLNYAGQVAMLPGGPGAR